MTDSNRSSYSRIVKTTSILAGSSIIDIVLNKCSQRKILAIFLGPAVYGTLSLYSGLIEMIGSVTSLGIGDSAVREIAKASATNDMTRIAKIIVVLRRVVWATGLLGLIVMACLSYPASRWTFNQA